VNVLLHWYNCIGNSFFSEVSRGEWGHRDDIFWKENFLFSIESHNKNTLEPLSNKVYSFNQKCCSSVTFISPNKFPCTMESPSSPTVDWNLCSNTLLLCCLDLSAKFFKRFNNLSTNECETPVELTSSKKRSIKFWVNRSWSSSCSSNSISSCKNFDFENIVWQR